MKNLKQKYLIVFYILCISVYSASAQFKSGPIIAASVSWLEKGDIIQDSYGAQYGQKDGIWKSQISFQVGYQFLFPLKNNFAINAALLYQSRGLHIAYDRTSEKRVDESKRFHSISVNGGINYYILGKIPLGVGLEPTFYLNTKIANNLQSKTTFDVPFVLKAGYNFDVLEIVFSYKQGFKSLYRNNIVGKAIPRDVQLSIFVPIPF